MRKGVLIGLFGAAVLLGMVAHQATQHAMGSVFLEQISLDRKVDDQMMAKYEAKQHADDEETMLNAAKMNSKWGGKFSNGVGSNTWAHTPWAKYDDAVKARRKQMLVQMPPNSADDASDESMSAYDKKHVSPEAMLAHMNQAEDSEVAARVKAGGDSELPSDKESEEMEHANGARDEDDKDDKDDIAEDEEEQEGKVDKTHAEMDEPKVEEEMMTDSDEGDLEDQKPVKLSLKDSISDCEKSCAGSDGCVKACKNVMTPLPTHTVKKRTVMVEGWEKEKASIIKKCINACTSSACKKSCTDPENVPAPEPKAALFVPAMTEELYQEPTKETKSRMVAAKQRILKIRHAKKHEPAFVTSMAYHYQAPPHTKMAASTQQKVGFWERLGDVRTKARSIGRSLRSPAMSDVPPGAVAKKAVTDMLLETSLDENAAPYYTGAKETPEENGGNPYAKGWDKLKGGSLDQVYQGIDQQLQPLAQEYPYLRAIRH